MKIYAVIDTNVIISALLSRHQDSATVQILNCLYDRVIIPIYNDDILEEYKAVLRRSKSISQKVLSQQLLKQLKKGA